MSKVETVEKYQGLLTDLANEKRILAIEIGDLYKNEGIGRLRSDHAEAFIKAELSAAYEKVAIIEAKLRAIELFVKLSDMELRDKELSHVTFFRGV